MTNKSPTDLVARGIAAAAFATTLGTSCVALTAASKITFVALSALSTASAYATYLSYQALDCIIQTQNQMRRDEPNFRTLDSFTGNVGYMWRYASQAHTKNIVWLEGKWNSIKEYVKGKFEEWFSNEAPRALDTTDGQTIYDSSNSEGLL